MIEPRPATTHSRLTEGMVTDPATTRNRAAMKINMLDGHLLPLSSATVILIICEDVNVGVRIQLRVIVAELFRVTLV